MVKESIKTMVRGAQLFTQRLRRKVRRGAGTVVIAPPQQESNRGDQALLLATLDTLQSLNAGPCDVICTGTQSMRPILAGRAEQLVEGFEGAFNSLRSFSEQVALIRYLATKQHCIAIGADLVDEGYKNERGLATLRSISFAAELGLRTRLISFSVNASPSPRLAGFFRDLAPIDLYPRDPVSLARLQTIPGLRLHQAADLAYLLRQAAESTIPEEVARFFARHPRKVIGINLTHKVFSQDSRQQESQLANIARALATLCAATDYAFILLPNDDPEDVDFMRPFARALLALAPGKVFFLEHPPNAREMKTIAGNCQHIFTCRLHLGILGLGQGCPMTGFPYQGKFEGQTALFGLQDCLFPLATVAETAERFGECLRLQLARTAELAAQVRERLPSIRELALSNFQNLGFCTSPAQY